ncbi:hypothetical protein GSI_05452 [Ganoderma sinense ZZ0214-1]|uniref:DUF6534 domain-containing protein n=1 Tax=Ganoderma sinense ZZ0214-1 TaxID=1077348 RepID=A0A2G8SET3_9APHY|nr:hypothetical protein GSI_05452 [Ganoderma sinense ZZ0214-1]
MSSNPSSSPLAALPQISIDKSFGSVLIATFIGIALYGVVLNQVYRYSRMYTADRIELKITVYATVILETVHIALSCHTCYYYLVTSYFNPFLLMYPTRPMQLLPTFTSLVIVTAQGFFARRAYLFGKRYRIWVLIAVVALICELGFCIATTAEDQSGNFDDFVSTTWLLACGSGCAAGADIILTTVLIVALRKSRSGVKRTDSTVDVLVLYTITTGLITRRHNHAVVVPRSVYTVFGYFSIYKSGWLTVDLLEQLVIIPGEVGIYTSISIVATKLYANTLLAALNRRKSLKDRADLHMMGTDFVFGTEIREGARAHNSLPVAIEFHTITHSDASTSAGTASNKDNISHPSASIEKLGNGNQPHDLQADVMNIC